MKIEGGTQEPWDAVDLPCEEYFVSKVSGSLVKLATKSKSHGWQKTPCCIHKISQEVATASVEACNLGETCGMAKSRINSSQGLGAPDVTGRSSDGRGLGR